MIPRPYDPQCWNKTDWASFSMVFALLLLYPLMNGFPFIYYDSWSYASGFWRSGMRSPAMALVMRPVIVIAGMWGYVVVQIAVTAFSFVFMSKYIDGRVRNSLVLTTIIFASVGLYSGWLMVDIWVGIGLFALFLVLTGYKSTIALILLGFSYATHYGNFPVFTGTALLFWVVTKVRRRAMIMVFLCLLGGMAFVVCGKIAIGDTGRFTSKSTYSWIVSRTLYDIPEILERKCQEDPNFKLCGLKTDMLAARGKQHSDLLFHMFHHPDISKEEYEKLAKELVIYSIPRFPLEHMVAAIKNTLSQLSSVPIANGFLPITDGEWVVENLKKYYPDEYASYRNSWQAKGHLHKMLKVLHYPSSVLYWLAILICLVSLSIRWKNLRNDLRLKFALFSLMAVIVNAFFMSNLSGVLGRFHTRIVYLPMLAALIIMWHWAENLKIRYEEQIGVFKKKMSALIGE